MAFPYQANEADVVRVLSDVTRRAGIIARIGDGVDGVVTVANVGGTLTDVLDEMAAQVQATWWYDGTILHVDSDETLTAVFVDAQGLSADAIDRELQVLGLHDPRFELRSSSSGSVVRVSGPQNYVDQVVALIGTLGAARRLALAPPPEDAPGLFLPRIYHGRPAA